MTNPAKRPNSAKGELQVTIWEEHLDQSKDHAHIGVFCTFHEAIANPVTLDSSPFIIPQDFACSLEWAVESVLWFFKGHRDFSWVHESKCFNTQNAG